MIKLEWGISPTREVAICWGARAIYHGPGEVDFVWDRQDMQGGTEEQRKELAKFMNEYGFTAIRKLTEAERLYRNDNQEASIQLHDWHIVVNPKASHGHLYIGVYPMDTGDAAFVPAPVPSPKLTKPKRVAKPRALKAPKRKTLW